MIYVGIDTGTKTGYAIWDTQSKKLLEVKTVLIHKALKMVEDLHNKHPGKVKVRVEDARQRTWFGNRVNREQERSKLQGVGSVKRDAVIWEDFLKDLGVEFEMVAPRYNVTKLDSETFKEYTKWAKRTSEHSRDAAMLVFGF